MLLFSPFAGVLADRYAKRTLLNWTQSIMGATALVMGIMAVTHTINVWHVYVLTFIFGTASALDVPARQAFVNEMVDRPRPGQRRRPQLRVVQPRPDDRSGAGRRADRADGLGGRRHRAG